MATRQTNIVQAEFFHVGGKDTPSLKALFAECGERVADSLELTLQGYEAHSCIKTVVRFFDETGNLTKIAIKAERIKKRNKKLLDDFTGATGLQRWLLDIKSRWLAGKIIALSEEARMLASGYLCEAIRTSHEVAVECDDHSFRSIKGNEAHEIVESASNSRRVWLFVFRPNNLLADTNTLVACLM